LTDSAEIYRPVDVRLAPKRPVPGSAKGHCVWPYACDACRQLLCLRPACINQAMAARS